MSLQNKTVVNLSKHGTDWTVSLNFPITAALLLTYCVPVGTCRNIMQKVYTVITF